jgi:hypothetical protein
MTTCIACGSELTPGVDYPREKEKIYGTEIGPETPILCWEPNPCIARAFEKARKEGYALG